MKKWLLALIAPLLLFSCQTRTAEGAEGKDEDVSAKLATADGAAEFADSKYTEIGMRHSIMFENGNIDGWSNLFADNAVMQWSNGDSLSGKKAIADYWKDRRAKVIESIDISNEIWLPVKVNKSQAKVDMPGVWLLHWHQFTAKYKNGKTLTGWIHTDFHFNDQNKVDRMVQYMDRAPIKPVSGEQ